MKITLTNRIKETVSSVALGEKPAIIHNVLSNWSLEARPVSNNGAIEVFLWDPNSKPDSFGRIHPVRKTVLSFTHQTHMFRTGLLGLGEKLQVARSLKP